MLSGDPVVEELSRQLVAERGVATTPVVEDLDVIEAICNGLGAERVPCTRSFFRLLKRLSIGTLE